MKRFSFIALLFVAMLAVAGCGNNEDANGGKTNEGINDNQEEVSTNNEEAEMGSQEDDSERNLGTMKLGDSGLIHDAVGKFEITPNSVEVFSERDGISPYNNEVFVLIDFTLENVSDDPIEGDQTLGTRLILENKEERKSDEKSDPVNGFDFVDRLDVVIEPGESHDAQMIFTIQESEEYVLHYGSGSGSIEDAEWKFSEEDISKEN